MLKDIFGTGKSGGLIHNALEEICRMLEQEEIMFRVACDALLSGQEPEMDVVEKDKDINVGERMVRRLVIEHLTVNPEQDLPASLTLIGIVHDVERIGDYTKGLIEFSKFHSPGFAEGKYAQMWSEIREKVEPILTQTREAFRESDAEIAREVMRRHREVKAQTDALMETAMQDPDAGRDAILYTVGTRNLRRISAHLSNIASGIANPFDLLGRND